MKLIQTTKLKGHGLKESVIRSVATIRDPDYPVTVPVGYVQFQFGTPLALARLQHANENRGLAKHLRNINGPVAYVDYIESRKKGVGTILMETVLEQLYRLGIKTVFAHVDIGVGGIIPGLVEFYAKFGFLREACCKEDDMPVIRLDLT